jgi:RNA polymerase sigma factor (TIGR02999 family)
MAEFARARMAVGLPRPTSSAVGIDTLVDSITAWYTRTAPRRSAVSSTISALLAAAQDGDRRAGEALFGALYAELHALARRQLAQSGATRTLGVTTLLHEAYLEIAEREGTSFPDQARFMGYAARVMRGVIIDHARSRRATKRGGQFELTSLDTDLEGSIVDHRELQEIGEAVDSLAECDAYLAEVVDLKFFCGFSFAEIAAMHGTSERTIQRHWEKARIYLHRSLQRDHLS